MLITSGSSRVNPLNPGTNMNIHLIHVCISGENLTFGIFFLCLRNDCFIDRKLSSTTY